MHISKEMSENKMFFAYIGCTIIFVESDIVYCMIRINVKGLTFKFNLKENKSFKNYTHPE